MNYQPQETWIIAEPTKQDIIFNLRNASFQNQPEFIPQSIRFTLNYQYTRSQPPSATSPEGQQNFVFYQHDNQTGSFNETVNSLLEAL